MFFTTGLMGMLAMNREIMNGYTYNMSPKTTTYLLTYCSGSDARPNTTPCTIPTFRIPQHTSSTQENMGNLHLHLTTDQKTTNLFKHTDVNISFKCHNTMAQLLKPARNTPLSSPFEKSGVYAISCVTCGKAYVGKTSRSINLRFKEHTRYIRHNNPQSAYAPHFLQHRHKYGSMDQTMTLLIPVINTSLLTHYELFFIQSLGHAKKLIPEQHTRDPNPLFQLAFKLPTPFLT
jgi:hypothetical protein